MGLRYGDAVGDYTLLLGSPQERIVCIGQAVALALLVEHLIGEIAILNLLGG